MVALIVNQEKVTREWLDAQLTNIRYDISNVRSFNIDIGEGFGERILETIYRGPLSLSREAVEALAQSTAIRPWTYITPPIGHMGPAFRFAVNADTSVRLEMVSGMGELLWQGILVPAWKDEKDDGA